MINDHFPSPPPLLRNKKSSSGYISDAAAIKEFYTAVCQVDGQELQHKIHKAMDNIIMSWTKRHDDMIEALNQLEHSYATLQHEAQAQATLYHKSVREMQFYKSKYNAMLSNNMNGNHHHHRYQQPTPTTLSSSQFDRRSCLSIDSCGRSTVTSNLSNTSSTDYSLYSKSSYHSHPSNDESYYCLPSFSSSSGAPSSVLSVQEPLSPFSPKRDSSDYMIGDEEPHYEEKISVKEKDGGGHEEDDTFDIMSVIEYSYTAVMPSANPPPSTNLPLPPPPSSSLIQSPSPSSNVNNDTLLPPTDSVPQDQGESEVSRNMHNDIIQTPVTSPPASSSAELSFACGEGFWNTIAKGRSHKEDVETLVKNYLKKGGEPNVANNFGTIKSVKEGYGLIHAIIVVRNTSALRSIIEAGVNPHALPLVSNDADRISPLVLAAQLGYMNGVRLLVERARVNILSSKGPRQENALLAAIENDALDVVTYLLRLSPQLLDQVDRSGATPLHYACMAGNIRMVFLLVREYGQNTDVVDYKGETPLHYAIRYRRAKVVAKLVGELGAYPNTYVVKKVPTPLDMAKSGGLRSIADYLKKVGAKTVKEMEKTSSGISESMLSSGTGAMSFVSLSSSSTHSGRTGSSSESVASLSSKNFVLGTASLMKNKLDELMM